MLLYIFSGIHKKKSLVPLNNMILLKTAEKEVRRETNMPFRLIKLFRLEKTHAITKSNQQTSPSKCTIKPYP